MLIILLYKGIQIYSGSLAIYALLPWFPGAYDFAFGCLLSRICKPYLSLFNRLNLRIGMAELNVMVGVIALSPAVGGSAITLRAIVYQ